MQALSKPKTIITYLVDGNPNGIRTVELSNWIGKGICIPRALIKKAVNRPELLSPGLYFLLGETEDGKDAVYIGEAEMLLSRLQDHDRSKDFWNIAIGFSSKDQNLTKADVKFLESISINQARLATRYQIMNSTFPTPNNLPEYQVATMEEFQENIVLLTSALGFPVMQPLINAEQRSIENKYFISRKGIKAEGVYNENGMIVLAGSQAGKVFTPSINPSTVALRETLLKAGVLIEKSDFYEFTCDYQFSSPSGPSDLICASGTNGWTTWKDARGVTLDEIERKA